MFSYLYRISSSSVLSSLPLSLYYVNLSCFIYTFDPKVSKLCTIYMHKKPETTNRNSCRNLKTSPTPADSESGSLSSYNPSSVKIHPIVGYNAVWNLSFHYHAQSQFPVSESHSTFRFIIHDLHYKSEHSVS